MILNGQSYRFTHTQATEYTNKWILDMFHELKDPLTVMHSSPPPSTTSSKKYGYEYPE